MKKLLLCIFLLPSAVIAQLHKAGAIDSAFGINGITLLPASIPAHFIITSDDSILGVGSDSFDGPVTMRFSKNGSLDLSYGIQGLAYPNLAGNYNVMLDCITRLADGKLLVAGGSETSATAREDFLVARLYPDGSLDTTFNHRGYVSADFYHGYDYVSNVAIQPDGKIIAEGEIGNGNFGIVRFNTDGSLDSSFCNCGTGLVIGAVAGASDIAGNAMALQPDGKILVGGSVDLASNNVFLLMRYNSNGTTDTNFGRNGIVETNFSNYYDEINALSLQPNGTILAAGVSYLYGADFAVARYLPNGNLDSSFGTLGVSASFIDSTATNVATVMGVQQDGKILLAGRTFGSAQYPYGFALARYMVDGKLDSTFGRNGVTFDQISGQDQISALGIQRDGKIVLSGDAGTGGRYDGLLIRYQTEDNTGVVNIASKNLSLKVYPNPTDGSCTISTSYKGVAIVEVTDVAGKVLFSNLHDFGVSQAIIDLDQYSSGLYLVKVVTGDGSGEQVVKIVKE